LQSQATIPASNTAFAKAKNNFTSWSNVWPSCCDTNCPKSIQWPGGSSEFGPSAQYSAIAFWKSVSRPL